MENQNIGHVPAGNERLDYCDLLKGVAITLVVMGHFLSWQWGGPFNSYLPDNIYVTLLRKIIYTFHMPLFFFLSGYVFMRSMPIISFKKVASLIYKRFCCIIIPGVTFMILTYFLYHQFFFPWFLRAIFELFIINIITYYISQKFSHKFWVEIFFQVMMYVILNVINNFNTVAFVSLLHLDRCIHNMPYFFIGTMSYRYGLIGLLKKYPEIGGGALLLYGGVFCGNLVGVISHGKGFLAYFAIISCLHIAVLSNNSNRISKITQYIGKNTLIIYLYHVYFLLCNSYIGYILEIFSNSNLASAIVSQLVISLFFSAISISFCLFLSKILEKSPITSFLFLGKRNTNKLIGHR